MKFARTGAPGAERPIVSGPDGPWRDLTPLTDTIDTDLVTSAERLDIDTLSVIEPGRFGPPSVRPGRSSASDSTTPITRERDRRYPAG